MKTKQSALCRVYALLFLCAFLSVSCALANGGASENAGGSEKGTITLGSMLNVVTDSDAATLTYTITLTGPGDTVTGTISGGGGFSAQVIPGTWTVRRKSI